MSETTKAGERAAAIITWETTIAELERVLRERRVCVEAQFFADACGGLYQVSAAYTGSRSRRYYYSGDTTLSAALNAAITQVSR